MEVVRELGGGMKCELTTDNRDLNEMVSVLEARVEALLKRVRELETENVLLRAAFDGAMHPHTFTTGCTEIKDHS